ncbi:MAG: choice-of-anchor D domain-containing protein [Bacteroidales bacterium]
MKNNLHFRTLLSLVFATILLSSSGQQRDWSIVESHDIPGKASGLAWDGTYLYFGIYGSNGDHVYQFDPASGNTSILFVNPAIDDSYGMTYDGQHLWIIDHAGSSGDPSLATELDFSGNIVSTITLPDHYMSGIAYDNDDFWVGTYYPNPGVIYKIDNSGTVLTQFDPPEEQTWDICKQDDDLWIADYDADMLYKTDQSGNILEAHPSENIKPAGIVFDGTYLWYCDGQIGNPSTLYKVDPGGAGTPVINIPSRLHDYGIITVGTSDTWLMEVQNTGTAELTITGLEIPPGEPVSSTFTPPETIAPGNSVTIPLTYEPSQTGSLNTTVTVESTDPITPEETVDLLGEAVNPGPSLWVAETSHDYGFVRMNAFTRWFLKIKNIGDETLTIEEINSSDPAFIVEQDLTFPININTLDSTMIGIWFNPSEGSLYNGELEIIHNDAGQNPLTVFLEGEGNDADWPIGEPLWHYTIDEAFDNSPKAIASIQDITGDGVADVIVCSEDYNIRCFNGNSSGTADVMWTRYVYSGSVPFQNDLTTIPDIDNDGYEDVIIGTAGGDRSIIALSGKTGDVLWKHQTNEYGSGGWVYQVDCRYDYNGDDFPDVLAATGDDANGTGPKRIYCLDGKDGESIWECFTNGPNFSVIGIRDFTGDGKPDVLGGAANDNETEGKVYGINGENGDIEWTYTTAGSSVWALGQLNDINGKGISDIIAGDFAGNYYLIDAENGSVIHPGYIGPYLILRFARLDDVNGDGHPDFLPGHSGSDGLMISGQDGSNIWFHSLADKSWNVGRIGDISGDGINDVIVGTLYQNNYCYFMNGVDGEEMASINFQQPVDAITSIPDITGDGSMEMVAGGRYGKLYCYSGGLNALVSTGDPSGINGNTTFTVYPNPVSISSGTKLRLRYEITDPAPVRITAHNTLGQTICLIDDGLKHRGTHIVDWNATGQGGSKLSPGIYIIRMTQGNHSATQKITLIN